MRHRGCAPASTPPQLPGTGGPTHIFRMQVILCQKGLYRILQLGVGSQVSEERSLPLRRGAVRRAELAIQRGWPIDNELRRTRREFSEQVQKALTHTAPCSSASPDVVGALNRKHPFCPTVKPPRQCWGNGVTVARGPR